MVLLVALCSETVAGRPHPLQAAQQHFASLLSLLHSKPEGAGVAAFSPPRLANRTALSLSVAWDPVVGADTYSLYADNWWANDGVENVTYTGTLARYMTARV